MSSVRVRLLACLLVSDGLGTGLKTLQQKQCTPFFLPSMEQPRVAKNFQFLNHFEASKIFFLSSLWSLVVNLLFLIAGTIIALTTWVGLVVSYTASIDTEKFLMF